MRAFTSVLRFELRLHFTAALFWGVAVLYFVLHLLTVTRTGINLGDNEQIAINSAFLIFQTHVVLGLFGMLPAIVFAVTAMTRDAERRTTELFFTTPVPRAAFLLGRFSGGMLAAIAIGCIGVAGAVAGPFMPWLEPGRVLPFDWRPWVTVLTVLVLPNLLVFCALFFGVAALTRSAALTFGVALGVLVLVLCVNVLAVPPVSWWVVLADPAGGVAVAEAARYWTVSELNTLLPTALLGANRVLWLGLAICTLLVTLWRFRMELPAARVVRFRWGAKGRFEARRYEGVAVAAGSRSDEGKALAQLWSQVRMDWRGVWLSPLFWVVLAMAAFATVGQASALRSPLVVLPLYPATVAMLDSVFPSLVQVVLLAILYYSAALVWRERDAGVEGITDAAPCPDWVPVVSKALVLCGVVLAILAVATLVVLGVQEAADFHDHALGVLLEGVFVNNGFYFFMFCVLAVLVQVLSPGKWSGMLLTLLVFVAVLTLPVFGFEHLLYGFRIPPVTVSDMNGFGHFRPRTYTLIAYWGAFCVLLLAAGHLLFRRGYAVTFRERLRDARARVTAPLARACVAAALAFAALGAFVFYNTNVLGDYVTSDDVFAAQARYERDYGRYRDLPAPSIVDADVRVELYPVERRLTSRGSARLRNVTSAALGEFVVTVDPRNRVEALEVDGAALVASDPPRGFYLFRPEAPLAPGAALAVRWAFARESRGFPGVVPDNDLVANGSYVNAGLMPAPGYCMQCELTVNRNRFGLPPAARLPALDEAARLDVRLPGLDGRGSLRIVIGTDTDQTAVAAGVLERTWEEAGRRYFEYALDGPTWADVRPLSARYTVARDEWNGVALEIYHDAKHAWNVQTMLVTAKQGLEYYSREFAPYPLPYYRMAEYARYTLRVQAGVGTVAYAEGSGFMTDLRGRTALDYATLHELAHQWWGAGVFGARVQGQEVLNEGLAQYSTFMAYKERSETEFLRRVLAWTHDAYLSARKSEAVAEQPVVRTEQSYIAYGKAPLALFALQELIGADKVNGALRAYFARFVNQGPPFPTTLDLLAELRAAAGPEHQALITDLFERIVLYDVGVASAEARAVDGGYEVVLDVTGRQLEADGDGAEREVPLDAWFQVAVFPESDRDVVELEPLYLEHHRIRSGAQRIAVRVAEKPGRAGVDPFRLMIDRRRDDNVLRLPAE